MRLCLWRPLRWPARHATPNLLLRTARQGSSPSAPLPPPSPHASLSCTPATVVAATPSCLLRSYTRAAFLVHRAHVPLHRRRWAAFLVSRCACWRVCACASVRALGYCTAPLYCCWCTADVQGKGTIGGGGMYVCRQATSHLHPPSRCRRHRLVLLRAAVCAASPTPAQVASPKPLRKACFAACLRVDWMPSSTPSGELLLLAAPAVVRRQGLPPLPLPGPATRFPLRAWVCVYPLPSFPVPAVAFLPMRPENNYLPTMIVFGGAVRVAKGCRADGAVTAGLMQWAGAVASGCM